MRKEIKMVVKDKVTTKKSRPMYFEEKPKHEIHAAVGTSLRCKTWEIEAALRMLENNLDPRRSFTNGNKHSTLSHCESAPKMVR